PEAERDAELQRQIKQDTRRPFDLACDPMLRAALFQLSDNEYLFVVTVHHIACDGAGMGLLLQELSHFYSATVTGVTPSLPEPLVQCQDFTLWQREILTPELREKQLAYWRQQLAGVRPALDLPSDRPRPADMSFRGGIEHRKLSKELSDEF